MDYKEEQKNEIEALESIYPDELKILTDDPEYSFSVDIKTEALRDDSDQYMAVSIKFTYVPSYPDEAPIIEIAESESISDDDINALLEFLQSRVEENLGMVMVFTLVSEATEWLNKKLQDNIAHHKLEEELKIKRLEEEERNRFEGKRVTVESFMTWKLKFDQEVAEIKKLQAKDEPVSKKLTGRSREENKESDPRDNQNVPHGRELFEKDKTLVDSDLQFLQDGEEEVKVDESLFQELDDLELQDEEISD